MAWTPADLVGDVTLATLGAVALIIAAVVLASYVIREP